jgi:hypothetical protein
MNTATPTKLSRRSCIHLAQQFYQTGKLNDVNYTTCIFHTNSKNFRLSINYIDVSKSKDWHGDQLLTSARVDANIATKVL